MSEQVYLLTLNINERLPCWNFRTNNVLGLGTEQERFVESDSLVGRYDNPMPTRFLAPPIDCSKFPARLSQRNTMFEGRERSLLSTTNQTLMLIDDSNFGPRSELWIFLFSFKYGYA
jgi:hypothetical protein